MIDAGDFYARNKVDGIIGVMAFGCGPDSLMMHLVQRRAQDEGIPFMCLTIEEHTAEAGIITRLEAFLDMIHRRTRVTKCV
jgi:predicted nucleotide-binding protein (sugar kinase/HSP70/actin superfamily)